MGAHMSNPDNNTVLIKGSWPLTRRADDGSLLWHIAGSNPPEYAPDERLEALWKQGQKEATMGITTLQGDCRETLATLPAGSVQCVVTSPPYFGLRKYSDDPREIGQEATPALYVAALVDVFAQVWRVLRDDGTCWLNLGDSYAQDSKWGGASGGKNYTSAAGEMPRTKRASGLKDKDLIGIPWRVAFALQDAGWYLRSDIIWNKPNCMPESVRDRPTRAHEYVFLLTKSARYFYDADAIAEAAAPRDLSSSTFKREGSKRGIPLVPGNPSATHRADRPDTLPAETRNKRTVWSIPTQPYSGAHYATMPEALIEPCILAGSRAGDTVLDPFAGSGTVSRVAMRLQRNAIGCELNPDYITEHIEKRTDGVQVELLV
jgi:DNA modification methylase